MNRVINVLITVLVLACALPVNGQVVINEFLSSNLNSNTDEDGSHEDWLELYNMGATPVNLNGYGLSDDAGNLLKWTFPDVSIESGSYLLIWCSDKNRTVVGNPLHTNWKISSSGESIYLSDASGTQIDTSPAMNLPADISYGRLPNGSGGFVYFSETTANAANAIAGFNEIMPEPIFSQGSGFFASGFDLTLTTDIPGAMIIYTLDGSDPNESNLLGTSYNYKNQYPINPGQEFGPMLFSTFTSKLYDAPLSIIDRTTEPNKISAISSTYDFTPLYFPTANIYKGTVVRARVVKPGALAGKIVTRNYFISPLAADRFTLPVVSISIDEDKLFDYDDGIYVAGRTFDEFRTAFPEAITNLPVGNYSWKGSAFERMVNFSYFVGGQEKINQSIGIRVQGNSSRIHPRKSLNFYSKSDYGAETMDYKFFADEPYDSFVNVVLKNLGHDFYMALFKDSMCNELAKPLHTQIEASQPTISFLNGEYWGIMTLREKYDDKFFSRVYDIPSGSLDLIENDGSTPFVEEGDNVDYLDFFNYIGNNSLAGEENFNYIKTRMDTESFTDYFITNIFLANEDWPGSNIIYWRKKTAFEPNAAYGSDGRWRWAIHDMDFACNNSALDVLSIATDENGSTAANPPWSTLILRKLLENQTFKNDFISRFADVMNSSFLPSRSLAQIETMKAQLLPEMAEQIARWNAPVDIGQWHYFTDLLESFVSQRPEIQRNHIREKFGIANNIDVTLDISHPEAGYVKINTIEIASTTPGISENPYPWTGVYFSDVPIKLKAVANPGFVFSHWSGASSETTAEIVISSAAAFALTAVFTPLFSNETPVPVNFWYMSGAIPNDTPLSSLDSSYEIESNASIAFQSALEGYPFDSSHPNWRKASMERRNKPTPINYRPDANSGAAYVVNDMKGLQITQPFQNNGLENTLVFNFSTKNYKNIVFSFAAMDEGAASGISIDYSVNPGEPIWTTSGLPTTSFELVTNAYKLFEMSFSSISEANDNLDFKIRLRFTGPDMTASDGNRVTFNNIALDGVKIPLFYPSPNVFTVGTEIAPLSPTVAASVISYAISPDLPLGLSFDTTTGIISGTPTNAATTATYTVTATNDSASTSFGLVITVNDIPPSFLAYESPHVFTVGSEITALFPTVTGNVTGYSISPALPDGLTLDPTTGIISGTPLSSALLSVYSVTVSNTAGSISADVIITVIDIPPVDLWYDSPNIFTLGSTITDLSPIVTGANVNYSVLPALPDGLFIDSATGVISGTPSIVNFAIHTITAANSGGSISVEIVIMVLPPLGVESVDSFGVEAFPNPFTDEVHFSGETDGITYKLFSIDGRLMQSGTISGSALNLSAMQSGMFLLQLSRNDLTKTVKLIKK